MAVRRSVGPRTPEKRGGVAHAAFCMTIKAIHAFLIYPGKGVAEPPTVSGKKLDQTGKLFALLNSIYIAEPDRRDFEVTFKHTNGKQENACGDAMIAYATKSSLENGRAIGKSLQAVTDNRSGIGLLFLMSGNHGLKQRLVVSRF